MENGPDDLQAFPDGFVGRPTGPGPDLRVGSIFIQRRGILLPPGAEHDPARFQDDAVIPQLPRKAEFFFWRESGLVCFERLRILIGNKIALGRAIGSLPYSLGGESAGNKFLGQEKRDFLLLGEVVIVDMESAGQDKTCVFVKVDVPFHAQETDAHFAGFLQSILKQP